jgi:signal peptidase I
MTGDADGGGQTAGATSQAEPSARKPPRRRRRRVILEWVVALVAALLLATGVRTWVFQVFFVPTPSMEPTLGIGDRILVQKAFFDWRNVHEGDILVFWPPATDTECAGPHNTPLVKRVIGLPGQTIYSRGNKIFINGHLLREPYLPSSDPLGTPIPGSKGSPFRVPPGDFYMMGDNRAISCDSRYWGPIKHTSIIGQVVVLLWHDGHPDFHIF